jgi:translation initiation factor 2B subunit (eIF-2B alpha/beta/delta family)
MKMMSGETLRDLFREIAADRVSGSATVLKNIVSTLKRYLQTNPAPNYSMLEDQMALMSVVFDRFAVLRHFLNSFIHLINKRAPLSELLTFVRSYSREWDKAPIHAATHLLNDVDFKDKRVMLFSNSSSLHALIEMLSEQNVAVDFIQCHSFPTGEGKHQAKKLVDLGFKVTFIADAAIPLFMAQTDIAVIGADLIYNDCILNKTGSLGLALAAQYFKKPLYVLSDSRKIEIDNNVPDLDTAREGQLLWRSAPEGVTPVNVYFERVARSLVTDIYLETGRWANNS